MELFKLFIIIVSIICFSCKPSPKAEKNTAYKNNKTTKDTLKKNLVYLNKDYVLGKFNYTKDTNFVKVPKTLTAKDIFIRKEVLIAFQQLCDAAKKEGIRFSIVSGTRNFAHQKRIWDYKWNDKYKATPKEKRALKILEYSSMPGTSRHHWGTDIDINNLENKYFSTGKGLQEYNWLSNNAHKFGFYQVYTSKQHGRTGYNEEKWHWSYVPLSSVYLDFYNKNVSNTEITGFQGSEHAIKIDMLKHYVNGINPEILNYTHQEF